MPELDNGAVCSAAKADKGRENAAKTANDSDLRLKIYGDDGGPKIWTIVVDCVMVPIATPLQEKGADGSRSHWLCQPYRGILRRTPPGKNFRWHRQPQQQKRIVRYAPMA